AHTKIFAFTLAETLITLAIIGVVAAMTIPSVLNHYREQEVVSKVKKFYSTFSSAIQLAIYENGTIDTWDLAIAATSSSAEKFADYIRPYLKIMTDCGTDTDNKCMDDTMYKKLNGEDRAAYGISQNLYRMILADGSTIFFRTISNGCTGTTSGIENACVVLYFDINGMQPPNQFARDLFTGYIDFKGELHSEKNDDCYLDDFGASCSEFIRINGNMNYPKTADRN
ncbi:MAG: type II secretion system GspH family protein, partial [Candidatus Gastranaerophilales bacterium]|nr:type II secretion system GspH family protein [Candidatus Gastranaerophilales bacterium]